LNYKTKTSLEEHKESSSINTEANKGNIDKEANFDSELVDSPIVTSLTTPYPQSAIRTHAATLRKLQEQESEIKAQQRRIEELTITIAIQDAHTENRKASDQISRTPSAPPALTETPEPHRLQLKPERPEDVAYRQKLMSNRVQSKQWVSKVLKHQITTGTCLPFSSLGRKS
jgi:hypothetical protein